MTDVGCCDMTSRGRIQELQPLVRGRINIARVPRLLLKFVKFKHSAMHLHIVHCGRLLQQPYKLRALEFDPFLTLLALLARGVSPILAI